MLKVKEPSGRFGRAGQFFDFVFTFGGSNVLIVKLLLMDLLDAPRWVGWTAWTLLLVACVWGFYLRWTPRRPVHVSVPGSNTARETSSVSWEFSDSDTSR